MCSCAIFITFLADTLGRRWSFVWTGYAMFVFMFYLGFYVRFDPPIKGAPVSSAGMGALVMVYLFAAAFQFGWGPVCWIYVSEIPTNRLRGYTVSLAAATQWLFNLVVTRVTPLMLKNVGAHGYGTYFIYGCFCFMMATAAFWVPETKGVSTYLFVPVPKPFNQSDTDNIRPNSCRLSVWMSSLVWLTLLELKTSERRPSMLSWRMRPPRSSTPSSGCSIISFYILGSTIDVLLLQHGAPSTRTAGHLTPSSEWG